MTAVTPSDKARPPGTGQPSALFVGRRTQLDELNVLAETITRGGPAGAMIFGAPGVGKTRLLAEMVNTLQWRCLRIQGYQNARGIALGASAGLLRELAQVPKVGERLDALIVGEAGRPMAPEFLRLFELAFRCALRLGPLAIVADDVQWADRESLSLLHYLVAAATSAGAPFFVLCASRPASRSVAFAAQCAGALTADHFGQFELGPLDEPDALELLNTLAPGLDSHGATELWRRASGSPFWLTALAADYATGSDRRRRSLQSIIRARSANLGADPAALFSLILVAAHPLSLTGIGELLTWPESRVRSAVGELVNRALVLRDGATISIAHDLIRETAERELAEDARVRVHRRLAEWFEASAGAGVRRLMRALEHRVAAGLESGDLALRIARSPQRRLIGNQGLALLGQIADVTDGTAGHALSEEVATLAFELGDSATALERWSALSDRAVGDERANAALAAGWAALKLGRSFDVHAYAAIVRDVAVKDPVLSIEADCLDAQSLLWLENQVGEAQPLVERALAGATRLVDAVGGTAALGDRECAVYVRAVRVRLDAAIRRADAGVVHQCAELIEQAARDPAEVLAAACDGIFSMLQLEGLPRFAEPRARRALEESRRLALPSFEVEVLTWTGWIEQHLGRLDESSEHLREAVALAERVGPPRRVTIAQLRAVLHATEASRTDVASNVHAIETLIAAETDPHFRLVIRTLHLGIVGRFSVPDASQLAALRGAIARDAAVAGCGRCLWESTLQAAEACARSGSPAAAAEAVGRWDAAHPDPHPGGPAVRRAYVEALLTARRDPGASVELFTGASQAAESIGYRLLRLWIDLDAAAALAAGDRTAAIAAYECLAGEAAVVGARSEYQLAEARLRGLGVHTWRRGPTSSPVTLSERERDIADAVARGATNPEIAASLFLSRKTVERHVSHILAKLGARNRVELTAMLAHEIEGPAG